MDLPHIKVNIISPGKTPEPTRRTPTVVERLKALDHNAVDDGKDPGTSDWYNGYKGVAFVHNLRGCKTGQGRKTAYHGQDVLKIPLPDEIPFDQIEDVCKHLLKLKDLGLKHIEQLKAAAQVAAAEAEIKK